MCPHTLAWSVGANIPKSSSFSFSSAYCVVCFFFLLSFVSSSLYSRLTNETQATPTDQTADEGADNDSDDDEPAPSVCARILACMHACILWNLLELRT